MLYLIILILLALSLFFLVRNMLFKSLSNKKTEYEGLKSEYDKLSRQNLRLKTENADLERAVGETIALYDITKDIYKTLNEEEIFAIFRERMNRYIKVADCAFLKAGADLSEYKDYTVLPLRIQNNTIGHLVASGIEEKDKDKFHILAHQFLAGLKKALLYERVQGLTITDSLTQVFIRRYFLKRFNEEMERSGKFNNRFSFLMIDIDHFKEFNDKYGHLVGDSILRETAAAIKENIRQIDFMGRYGGEELSIVLTETGKEQARFVAERIRQAIEKRQVVVYDEVLKVTISIGISTFPDDAADSQAIIDKADEALYLAKQAGRNRVLAC